MYLFSIFITSIGLVKYNNMASLKLLFRLSAFLKLSGCLLMKVRLSKASNIVR